MYKSTPISLFHGSTKIFDKFDNKFIRSATGTAGAGMGHYMTSEILEASGYGNIIYEVDFKSLKLKNYLSNFKRTLNSQKIIKIIDDCLVLSKGECNYYENFDDYSFNDYKTGKNKWLKKEIEQEIIQSFLTDEDTRIISDFVNAGFSTDILFKVLNKMGYTHTLDQYDQSNYPNAQHYILYFEPKIKNRYKINNPTELEKIRNKVLGLNK